MATLYETEKVLHGIGVSSGVIIGTAFYASRGRAQTESRVITEADIATELGRVNQALEKSKAQLRAIQSDVENSLGSENASLFDSYLMILEDHVLLDRIETIMTDGLVCAEAACAQATEALSAELEQIEDEYIRERAKDFRDIGERIVRNLLGIETDLDVSEMPDHCILVADDITPSETARLDATKILAFVTAGGSRTSHTAILSRALGIPAIVAVREGVGDITTGTELALDGDAGVVYVRPTSATKIAFERKRAVEEALQSQLEAESSQPVETLDGYQACLVANVELPSEALNVRQKYNVGIGLFRTEFLFINGMKLQDEEQQFAAYRETVEAVKPYSVIFRTLDVGGDKFLNQLTMPHELNPFMGMRAIRFSLSQPEIFKVQLRAILRASAFGKVRIMFPMISTYDELDSALKLLDEVKLELTREHVAFNDSLDVGCMIEVPSAALLASRLVKRLTFFSLGTNDLTQYSLAVDRSNSTIGHLYQPAHPSIIRMMRDVVEVAYESGRWVSICGEMAGESLYTPLILGLGIHELSMSPVALNRIRMVIRSIRMHEAEALVNYALGCDRYSEVVEACREFVGKACPGVLGQ